jgi:tRNA pseudouridine32 synthase/23S rRNA pseudouridine746 synthase/23S rRNA pseudouridine1911/1915/1917 synthase
MITLLERLQKQYPDSSKNTLRSWIEHKRIQVKGRTVLIPHYKLSIDDPIEVLPKRTFLQSGLEILFEDRDLVVIDKPVRLLSVASETEKVQTAHDILKRHMKPTRPHPVHRLDRDTSGVLVFSKNDEATAYFKEEFFHHRMERYYLAVVEGHTPERGTWENYMYEDERLIMQVTDNPEKGKRAITHFERVERYNHSSLLRIRLETGRKNQIRLQATTAGFPIVGDTKYGARTNPLGRLGLHAALLGFVHPTSRKKLLFSSRIPFPELF